jgi:hypothetical protein
MILDIQGVIASPFAPLHKRSFAHMICYKRKLRYLGTLHKLLILRDNCCPMMTVLRSCTYLAISLQQITIADYYADCLALKRLFEVKTVYSNSHHEIDAIFASTQDRSLQSISA